jgi:hypothetical protein
MVVESVLVLDRLSDHLCLCDALRLCRATIASQSFVIVRLGKHFWDRLTRGHPNGCQLNRPLHNSLGGGPNFCTCHTCFGKYEDCPEGESCAFTNEITGETSQRYVDRFLTNDRSQCTLCSTDVDDHCSMWGTHYGQKGQEACICRTCYKGWGVNLEGTCVQYMTKDVTATGEIDRGRPEVPRDPEHLADDGGGSLAHWMSVMRV